MKVRDEEGARRGRQLTSQSSASERSEVTETQMQIAEAGKRSYWDSTMSTFTVILSSSLEA